MTLRLSMITLALAGCSQIPRPFGPELECGSFYPEVTAYRAGCSLEIDLERIESTGFSPLTIQRQFDNRGLMVQEAVSSTQSTAPPDIRTWEWDENGELMRTEGMQYGDPDLASGVVYERDERGMLAGSFDLVGQKIWEFDLNTSECTWSERRSFREGEVFSTVRAEWWEERPILLDTTNNDAFTHQERFTYDDDGLNRTWEHQQGEAWLSQNESDYDEHGQLSARRTTMTSTSNGISQTSEFEERWDRNPDGNEVAYVRTHDSGALYSRTRSWQGPFHHVLETFEGTTLMTRETWTWDCPPPI